MRILWHCQKRPAIGRSKSMRLVPINEGRICSQSITRINPEVLAVNDDLAKSRLFVLRPL
jgi:hypothetical protein